MQNVSVSAARVEAALQGRRSRRNVLEGEIKTDSISSTFTLFLGIWSWCAGAAALRAQSYTASPHPSEEYKLWEMQNEMCIRRAMVVSAAEIQKYSRETEN